MGITYEHISPIQSSTITATKTTAQERINNANSLSVTPEFQEDLAVITNLNGVDQGPTEPDFESLIYNASSVLSGTSEASLLTGDSEQEQIKKLTEVYNKTLEIKSLNCLSSLDNTVEASRQKPESANYRLKKVLPF